MLNLMFFVKTLVMTILIVLLLQIHVGSLTLEDHARQFIQTSAIASPIQEVAVSGAVAVRKGMNWVSREINERVKGHWFKGNREGWRFHRSDAYEDRQKEKN